MEIVQIIVILVVIGVLLWLVNTYVPMDAQVNKILNAVVIIALVLWLLFWILGLVGLVPLRPMFPRATG
jgi:hypothetical protein